MIKNPINPDLNLWIGAIERIYNSGINKVIAIHRGFSSYNKTQYRNDPMWEIPIELKRIFPDLFLNKPRVLAETSRKVCGWVLAATVFLLRFCKIYQCLQPCSSQVKPHLRVGDG